MGTRAEGLRKAAILIDSLDPESADLVLGNMPSESADSIRRAVLELASVDSQEREQVLQELGGCETLAAAGDVELDESRAEKLAGDGDELEEAYAPTPDGPAAIPFSFLSGAPTDVLSDYLSGEHPQAVSVVLAHLPPRQAAELLRCLPSERKRDVLNRLARLDAMDAEVVRHIEQGLRVLLADRSRRAEQQPAGLAAVEAILDAADDEQRGELIRHLAPQEHSSVPAASNPAGGSEAGYWCPPQPARQIYHDRVPAAQVRQRVGNLLDALSAPQRATSGSSSEADPVESRFKRPETALEFDDFANLNDTALARVFRAAAPQVTLVALCGASRDLVNRILASLPLREARALRSQIEQLGPTRLRDIESAQLRLAELARQMADEGQIQVPQDRRFIVAA